MRDCFVLCVAGIYNSELSLEWQDDSPVLVPAHVDLSDYYVSSMWTNTNKQREFYMARFHRYEQHGKLNCYVQYEETEHRISRLRRREIAEEMWLWPLRRTGHP